MENLLSELADRKYPEVHRKASRIFNKFIEAIHRLKNALKDSRRFYQTMSNGFKATIQSGEEIPLREVLTFLHNTADRSIEIHKEFEGLRATFFGLYGKVNELRGDIRRITGSNDDKSNLAIVVGLTASVLTAIAAPQIYLPIVAASSIAGGGYIVKKGQDDNNVLDKVKSGMTSLRNYSKKIADIIEEMDAMKTASAINNYQELPGLNTEAYKYYMEDLAAVAKENYDEIEHMIQKLTNI